MYVLRNPGPDLITGDLKSKTASPKLSESVVVTYVTLLLWVLVAEIPNLGPNLVLSSVVGSIPKLAPYVDEVVIVLVICSAWSYSEITNFQTDPYISRSQDNSSILVKVYGRAVNPVTVDPGYMSTILQFITPLPTPVNQSATPAKEKKLVAPVFY